MKAIRVHQFGGPEVLRLEDVPDPRPSAGQIVVRHRAIGVNPVDAYVRAGGYGPKTFPYTPGNDAAGIVEATGDGVRLFRPGDRVYVAGTITGAYAELSLCNESTVHPLPPNISIQQGAAIGVPCATAYYGLFHRGRAMPGEDAAGPWRHRRRGHRRRTTRPRRRPHRHRHRRHRRGPPALARTGRPSCAGPSRPRLPQAGHVPHRQSRRRPDPRNAGQREPRQGPDHPGQARPSRSHRQPGSRRDRSPPRRWPAMPTFAA